MPASVSRRSVVAMRQSYVLLHDWPPHHDGAVLGRGHEAELLVQPAHGLVPLLALGEQAPEAAGPDDGRDLGALERGGDSAAPPVAPGGRQRVEALLPERVQCRVADDLLAGERDEAELGLLARLVDLLRLPLVEGLDAGRAGDVLVGLGGDHVHALEPVRLLGPRRDAHAGGRIDLGRLHSLQLEHERLLRADANEPAALEEGPRVTVALLDLPLKAVLAEAPGSRRNLSQHRRADPTAAAARNDGDVAGRDRAPGLDEPAGDGLLSDPRAAVVKVCLGLPVVRQVLDGGLGLWRNGAADG